MTAAALACGLPKLAISPASAVTTARRLPRLSLLAYARLRAATAAMILRVKLPGAPIAAALLAGAMRPARCPVCCTAVSAC